MKKRIPIVIVVAALVAGAWWGYSTYLKGPAPEDEVLGGSGTIEADEVAVAPLLAGRIASSAAEEGMPVSAGDVLFTLDGAIAAAQVEQAKAGVRAAEAALAQVNDDGGSDAEIAGATARVDQAKAMLAIGEVQLAYAQVTAPVDGTITNVVGSVGQVTAPGKTLATVADLSRLTVSVYVSETHIGDVRLGQQGIVRVDSSDKEFDAEVVFISDHAEFTPSNVETREQRVKLVYEVRLTVDNADDILKPGMPADVDLQ